MQPRGSASSRALRVADIMATLIVAIGVLIALPSIFALMGPKALMHLASNLVIGTGLRIFAGLARIALGIGLILAATYVPMTVVVQAFGGVLILVGVVVLFVSNETIQSIVDWATSISSTAFRIGGATGLGLGGFLIYAGI